MICDDENYGQKYDHLSLSSSAVGTASICHLEGVDIDSGGASLTLVVVAKIDGEEVVGNTRCVDHEAVEGVQLGIGPL